MVNKQLQHTHCPISHEVKTTNNETWSVNRMYKEKYYYSKIIQKVRQGD